MASEIRRDRPLRTCQACRRRKIKCDKIHPSCSQCQKAHLTCAYENEQPQRVEFQFIAETPGSSGSASGQSQATQGRLTREESSASPPRGHISQQPGRRVRYVENTYWAYDPDDEEAIDTLLGDQTRFEIFDPQENPEKESQDTVPGTGTQAAASEQASISGKSGSYDTAGLRTTIPYRLTGDLASAPPAFKPTDFTTSRYQRRTSTILLKDLPSKALCDRLVDLFMIGYHPIIALIHAPTFRDEYEKLWKTRPDDFVHTQGTSHFVCLVLAVLFAGSVALPNIDMLRDLLPENAQSREELEKMLHVRASRALRQASFPRTTSLETFTAYLLVQVTWIRFEEPLTTCAFIGLAYRVAQMLGLHREPSKFASIDPITAEVRRRLWWFLLHVDNQVAIAAGLPPMIDLATSDVRPVSELKEELIGTPEGLEHEAQVRRSGGTIDQSMVDTSNSMYSTAGILQRGRYNMTVKTKDLLSLIYSSKPITAQDLIRVRINNRAAIDELKARINRIPATPIRTALDPPFHSIVAQQNGESYLNLWARLYLSLQTDYPWIVACHPALKTPITEVWRDIEPKALEHCRDYLRKTAQISCFEEFQYFHWSWPGHQQPLFTTMILLTELRKHPRSAAAPSYREVIDIVFALCGPGGGLLPVVGNVPRLRPLTEGGSESWELLWRFRQRAWREAGLDPHILWTREQALESLHASYDHKQHENLPSGPIPPPDLNEAFDFGSVTPVGTLETPGTGLVDPSTPMPNVDMSFWEQMVSEHGEMDLDLGNYEDFDLNLGNP